MPAPEPNALPIEGQIDTWDGRAAQGWAWYPADASVCVSIEAIADDGRVIAVAEADIFRDDLARGGKRGGKCAFTIELSSDMESGHVRLRARTRDALVDLEGRFPIRSFRRRSNEGTAAEQHALAIEGCLDEWDGRAGKGWVRCPDEPDLLLLVDAVDSFGKVVAEARAGTYRGDLAHAGKGDGHYAFAIRVPDEVRFGAIRLRVRGDGVAGELGGPFAVKRPPSSERVLPESGSPAIEGDIDQWDGRTARGWVWCPEEPTQRLTVEAVTDDDRVIASAIAGAFRGDLAAMGRRGGWCAFIIDLPSEVDSNGVRLRVRGDGISGTFESRLPVLSPDSLHTDRAEAEAEAEDGPDLNLRGEGGIIGALEPIKAHSIRGWVHRPEPFAPPVRLQLWARGECLEEVVANLWRNDLEDARQGNGAVGFDIAFPPSLYDGRTSEIDLHDAETSVSLLAERIPVTLSGTPPPPEPAPELARPAEGAPIALSVIVNFYNMKREAERTLTSLTRQYQRDIGELAYEVICVDNGSNPPLDADWVAGFGPEFRLFRPAQSHASPVFALNAAAAEARGEYLAMMIDGAHILSPRVLCEAMQALREQAGVVVGVRYWFVGGDQRWLSQIGYTREQEDILFSKMNWPADGYRLFAASAPIFESPNHWYEGMAESNCLFMSREAFVALGGYDEGFSMPGAGFANLDLFVRAARAPGASVVSLLGEATFHQYHGGTTTNVSDADKDVKVRSYAAHYERLRGHPFRRIEAPEIRVRGKMRGIAELTGRQRPAMATLLGLTNRVRPADLSIHFDCGAQEYLRSVYAETGMRHRTTWAGQPADVAPADLIEIQQMLWAVRPEVLVLKNVAPGLAAFVASIRSALQLEGMRIIAVCDTDEQVPPGVEKVIGHPMDEAVLARVEDLLGTAESCCVLFQPLEDDLLPIDAIARYASLVSASGYLVVLNSGVGQPELAYSRHFILRAIRRFLDSGVPFVIDSTMNAHLVTTCPSGFLRRIPSFRGGETYQAIEELEEL
jgi:cephalosporin hydroxylase/GT2 family glycosyltransferase